MTPEDRAREALMRCLSKRPWLEEYLPEITRAITEAIAAEREACAQIAERYAAEWLSARHIGMDIPTTLNSQLTAQDLARRIRART